jgi:excinuclease ABC subunit A
LKVARELAFAAKKGGRKCYILDEPTTGLHPRDVEVLCAVLDRLVDNGHTVIVIEHDMDVVKRADWIIDMGPDGGDGGGRVVAMGRPEEIVAERASATGRYLRRKLGTDDG